MTITNGYATLDEFKVYATMRGGTVATDTTDDGKIEVLIETASRFIDHECNRRFYTTTADETRYYTAEDGDLVFVDDLSAAPTGIWGDLDFSRTYGTSYASTDYDLEPTNALQKGWPYTFIEQAPMSAQTFPTTRQGVKITGKFGFPSVPTDIKSVCMELTWNIYQSTIGQSNPGATNITAAGVIITPREVPPWAARVLKNYAKIT